MSVFKFPKILYLVMSCRQDLFEHEETVIKDTWMKFVGHGNVCIIYKGNYEKISFSSANSTLYCTSDDSLDGTFIKTQEAIRYIRDYVFNDFDYIVRTNTSTYTNVGLIEKFLLDIYNRENLKDKMICGDISVLNHKIQLRGNSIIIPRHYADLICDFNVDELKNENLENLHDDVVISHIWEKNSNNNYSDELSKISHELIHSPCIYFNDEYRKNHPQSLFDYENNWKKNMCGSLFLAFRKNKGCRYDEIGECYKIHDVIKDSNSYTFLKFNKIPIWIYELKRFMLIDNELY